MDGYTQSTIQLNNREISLDDILSGNVTALTSFEASTFNFIKEWLNKVELFKLQTSGSTGTPKEITLTRNQFKQSAFRTLTALDLNQHDTAFICLDTKYIAGKMMLVRALEGNLKIVAVEPAANPIQNLSSEVSIDFAAFVPMQLQEMLKSSDGLKKLNRLKAIIIGGGAVSTKLHQEIQKISCPVFATYGMTETVSHVALQRLNGAHASDCFNVLAGIKVEIDKRGCLVIQVPEFTEKIISNDLVELIDSTQFRWLGRYDNIINSGGFKISPEKIEKLLEAILPNRAFFITSFHDERLGEKLVMVMEGNPIPIDFSTLHLHPYEIPKEVILLPEFIRTETGKINRTKTMRLLGIG
jgi:O-succinylbenzoic acid--CoA ligase